MMHTEQSLKETLQPVLRVLNDLGGKFTFTDEDGNQFVLAAREVLEDERENNREQQLPLPQADTVSRAIRKHIDSSLHDDVLERVNRDIALAYASDQEQGEELVDDLTPTPFSVGAGRIRFEPLRGDLPPDLQE